MPTRKQVRRRQKERRHEYEYVYVDEEGNEVAADDDELQEPEKPRRRDAAGRKDRKPARNRRTGRTIQPPSWRRVGKRGLIFAPLMFLTVYLLAGDELPIAGVAVQTFFLLAIFLPFSYAMDAMTYRMWRRRTGQADAPRRG